MMHNGPMTTEPATFSCDRCAADLTPGKGNFYVVKIEAVADPSPPILDEHYSDRDLLNEIDRLIAEVRELSEQELLDQVYRRKTIFLCLKCYRQWIEDPAGARGE